MKIVLLSGGSGKRLWPMSNESRSKQFLKVLQNEKNESISMLQRVWGQLQATGLANDTFVCASKSQLDMIVHQIGNVPIIEEPMRRDTFPAISLATLYLLDVAGCHPNEPVAVIPVDHYVDNHYFEQISKLPDVLRQTKAELVLMGVKPSKPTSKFGYISVRPFAAGARWRVVDRFVEKPDEVTADKLIQDGALWNCGVFCFSAGSLRETLQARGLPTTYAGLRRDFQDLPKRSFDYEIVEKAKCIVVCPYDGAWKDLGTWSSLSAEIQRDVIGIGSAVNCANTHVVNELGIPVVSLGMEDTIVIATPDGILVANKDQSAQLKDVIEPFVGRPMYEERRWGSYRVLDYQKLQDGIEVLTKCIELLPGRNISYQKHMKRSEVWTIIEGSGEVAIDTHIFPVAAGDVIRIYAEQWHAIRATDALKFIEVQRGSELIEEDIVRRYLTWKEVETACSLGVNRT